MCEAATARVHAREERGCPFSLGRQIFDELLGSVFRFSKHVSHSLLLDGLSEIADGVMATTAAKKWRLMMQAARSLHVLQLI